MSAVATGGPRTATGRTQGAGATGRAAVLVAAVPLAPTEPQDASGARAAEASAAPVADWCDLRGELGRGHRHEPVAAQLALAAGRRALAALGAAADAVPGDRRSLCVATSTAVGATHARMDATVLEHGTTLLSPLTAPYFSVNLLGSRLSADLVAHGGATTFTTPATAVADALVSAGRDVTTGRCDLALVVAVEEAADPADRGTHPPETGAVALVLAADDGALPRRAVPAPAVHVRRGTWSPGALAADLDALTGDLVAAGGGVPGSVVVLAGRHLHPGLGAWAPPWPLARVELRGCGAGAYRPAAALLDGARRAVATGASALVLVVGPDGHLAGAHLRVPVTAPAPTHTRRP